MNPHERAMLNDQIKKLRERVTAWTADAPAWQHLGFALHQSGRYEEAVRAFERAAALKASGRVQAIPHALSLSALARHEEAIAVLRPLQASKRKDFDLANLFGVILKRAGRFGQALRMFERARGLRPGNISAWVNSGNTREIMGNFKDAAAAFGQAARLKPADAELWRLHGVALFNQGLHDEACRSLDKAASLAPGDSRTFASRVHVLLELDKKDEAVAAIERFRSMRPDDHEATVMLARMRFRGNRVDEARKLLDEVLRVEPGHLSANLLLGLTCGDGVSEDTRRIANEAFRRALEANPDSWKAAERLVDSLSRSRHDSETEHLEAAYAVACELQRKHPAERFQTARTLRTIFSRMMDLERMAAMGRLGELLPQWQAADNFSAVHYELGQVESIEDRVELVEWHRQWGRKVLSRVRPVTPAAMPPLAGGRTLRVGFMSSDLRDHPVGYFAYPLLSRYDRDRVEVYCYSFAQGQRSAAQAQMEKAVTAYRWWPGQSSAQVAEGIAADGLDILFELGGSTAMNKLDVMAYRPARIGARWLAQSRAQGCRVGAYGAAAKGNTFLNAAQVGADGILAVADRNPAKQGRLLPGSHIPVVSPEELLALAPDDILILPWNIAHEIVENLRAAGYQGHLLTALPRMEVL